MNRAKANYWADVWIGMSALTSAISGLVFLIPRNPAAAVLGVSYQVWSDVHTWSSLAAIMGVGAHLVLHWKWMVAMTKQLFSSTSGSPGQELAAGLVPGELQGWRLSRRAFLALGGAVAAVTGALFLGYRAVYDATASPDGTGLDSDQLEVAQQERGVACPFGLVNDPYPGRCRHYRDSNGDGICDHSVVGSGSNQTASGDSSSTDGLSRRRSGFRQP